jgi:hypothetical protein
MDLNPENYNLNEISNFFELNPNHTITEINDSFRRKHNQVMFAENIEHDQKNNMCSFFEELKNKLVLNITQNNVVPSSLNFKLTDKIDDHVDTVINSQVIYPAGGNHKEVSAGFMNPIDRNVIKTLIHIDTRFKQNYVVDGNTKFTFKMPTSFKNVIAIKLNSFEQPPVVYNFSESLGNNTLQFALGTNAYQNITIDDGNYTKTTLVTEVSRAINANTSISAVTCALDADSGLLNISHASNIKVKFPGINNKVNLGYILGFNKTEYTGNASITAEKVLDTDFNNYYYLSLNDYQGSAHQPHYAVMNQNFVTKNIFAKLKNNKESENTDYFIKKNYFGPVTLERFTFELLDKYGNSLDVKGSNYSFSLELDILYKY